MAMGLLAPLCSGLPIITLGVFRLCRGGKEDVIWGHLRAIGWPRLCSRWLPRRSKPDILVYIVICLFIYLLTD